MRLTNAQRDLLRTALTLEKANGHANHYERGGVCRTLEARGLMTSHVGGRKRYFALTTLGRDVAVGLQACRWCGGDGVSHVDDADMGLIAGRECPVCHGSGLRGVK